MKKVTLFVFCFLFAAGLMAQKIYFVYLQTENRQPFFVRMNEKVYSSTTSGYLILSKLIDSSYNFKIGFPGQNVDLNFSVTINKKDHGYLLRNFTDKGWALIDLQTLSIQMPVDKRSSANSNLRLDTNINAFTELLSRAADDTTLKYVAVVREEEKKPEIIYPVVKVELPVKSTTEETSKDEPKTDVQPEKKTDTVQSDVETGKKNEVVKKEPEKKQSGPLKETPYKKSEITKLGQNEIADGVEIVYADRQQEKTDTITIVIDQPKTVAKIEERSNDNKTEKKFLDISTDSTRSESLPVIEKKEPEVSPDTMTMKTDRQPAKKPDLKKLWPFGKNKNASAEKKKCDVADNDDFLKLRRKMATRTNDEGMIDEAKRFFRSKCFTTEQIRNLSSMFLSNAGKYHFFDTAHEFVADKENFASLQSELKDEYYIARFKEMVQN